MYYALQSLGQKILPLFSSVIELVANLPGTVKEIADRFIFMSFCNVTCKGSTLVTAPITIFGTYGCTICWISCLIDVAAITPPVRFLSDNQNKNIL